MAELTEREKVLIKELVNSKAPPWWRNYTFLFGFCLGLLGFFLSLATAALSVYTNHRKDIHDQRAELAAAIRTIQELNLKGIELREKYKGSAEEVRAVGFLNNYINSTVLIASDTAFQLGSNATTSSVSALSQMLYNYGDYVKAQLLAQLALDVARGPDDEAAAQRILGYQKIRAGDRIEGDRLFLLASTVDQRHDLARLSGKRDWLRSYAQLRWADALAPIDCDAARRHFIEAVTILNSSGSGVDLDRSRAEAKRAGLVGIGGIRKCIPAQDTPAVQESAN